MNVQGNIRGKLKSRQTTLETVVHQCTRHALLLVVAVVSLDYGAYVISASSVGPIITENGTWLDDLIKDASLTNGLVLFAVSANL